MDDNSARGAIRHPDGRFARGNPGRPLGARGRISQRVALALLQDFAQHEGEILKRLRSTRFAEYTRLIGRMLPEASDLDASDLEALAPEAVARTMLAVRAALDRAEAGEGSLADVEAALIGLGEPDDPPKIR